jgi:hypothetical protein
MEIDINLTSLATLALPVIGRGYAPGSNEFRHQARGQCPRENHLGEAKNCALQTMADSQMAASARRAAMRSA